MQSGTIAQGNAVFSAIANPERRMMLDMLKEGERPAGEIAAAFPSLPQPAVSRHLRVLREAGLVKVRAIAQQRIYALQARQLREIDSWISHYRAFWDDMLDALESHLGGTGGDAGQRGGSL